MERMVGTVDCASPQHSTRQWRGWYKINLFRQPTPQTALLYSPSSHGKALMITSEYNIDLSGGEALHPTAMYPPNSFGPNLRGTAWSRSRLGRESCQRFLRLQGWALSLVGLPRPQTLQRMHCKLYALGLYLASTDRALEFCKFGACSLYIVD